MTPEKRTEKILRVGVVQGGRIIEERLLRPREAVTIGQSTKNKFSIPSPKLPLTSTVVDFRNGKYLLQFEKGMLGKVLVGDEVLDLKTIAQRGLADRKENRFALPLTEASRGKIVVGDVTLLFQFVLPPPEIPRLQMVSGHRASVWQNTDRTFVLALLFAVVTIGGTFAYMDLWWRQTGRYMAPVRKTESRLFATLVSVTPPEEKKEEEKPKDAQKKEEEKPDPTVQAVEAQRIITMAGSQALAEAAGDDAGLAGMDSAVGPDMGAIETGAVGKIDLGMPAPANLGGPSTRPVPGGGAKVAMVGTMFGDGEGTVADGLAQGRRRASGLLAGPTTVGTPGYGMGGSGLDSGLALGTGLGGAGAFAVPTGALAAAPATFTLPTNAGKIDVQSAEIKTDKTQIVVVETNSTNVEREPEVKFSTSGDKPGEKPEVAEVRKKIRGRSSGIQRCYKTEVRKNRQLAGKVKVRVQVDNEGMATVTVIEDQMAGSNVSGCIVGVLKQIVFNKARADIYQTFMFSSE